MNILEVILIQETAPLGIDSEITSFLPLTPERWDDFVSLFGESGAYSG